eukprot:CAMPEP_0185584116 /NCGR_PEP_ID=MMETSP0434-20130131/30166_1 /TAXON_ID=626734 ORGANISM="Favella taraikaensis, Strain Fe Narragansett Bay" /NCGR_SAMPLE_ID=MMETSP0434 /ASSEMBLY_ACC=CAM_ASM_000379 /LENGTH=70 /DNA_ID=CAMNT_0028203663 /DNA_START=1330 /DNA_END=1542 /DNA_ORIENTATION=-
MIDIGRPGKAAVEDDAFGFVTDDDDDDQCVGEAEALRSDEGKMTMEKEPKEATVEVDGLSDLVQGLEEVI